MLKLLLICASHSEMENNLTITTRTNIKLKSQITVYLLYPGLIMTFHFVLINATSEGLCNRHINNAIFTTETTKLRQR